MLAGSRRFGNAANRPVVSPLGSPSSLSQGIRSGDTPMGYGVIGSTTDSGSVSLGSSPGTPALVVRFLREAARFGEIRLMPVWFHRRQRASAGRRAPARAPLCSGLARRPLKAVARVRIPSGLQSSTEVPVHCGRGPRSFPGTSARGVTTLTRAAWRRSAARGPRSARRGALLTASYGATARAAGALRANRPPAAAHGPVRARVRCGWWRGCEAAVRRSGGPAGPGAAPR